MASRHTDKYGNPAHHTGHLGAPGTTGAFETHDPLGAPGTTGASPTTGYNGQEQLHRPAAGVGAGHHVPLNTAGTTDQGYAYGTAATTGHLSHAQVAAPHTAGLTGTYDTGAHRSDSDRIEGAGQGTHRTGGYDTGSFGGGAADIGHVGHEGQHGGGYDTSVDKGRGGGYAFLGQGVGGAHGGGYDTGGDKGQGVGGGSYDTGGRQTRGQGLGGHGAGGGYEAGSDWAHTEEVKEHGGGYDTGGKKGQGQEVVKEHSASGYDTGGDWTHSQEVREHGGEYDIGTDEQVHGSVSATVVEVVTEEPMQEEESKGFIDRIMEHLPGTK